MSLVGVVLLTTLFTSLILVMATFIWTNTRMNALVAGEISTYYLTESGLEYALRRSLDLNNWNWSLNGNYGGGQVSISVSNVNGDTMQIISQAKNGITAKQSTLNLKMINFLNYSVYVSGDNYGILGYDSPHYIRFNVDQLPLLDLDSLKSVAKDQGHYYKNNLTISNSTPAYEFWSNPLNHDQDANITYVEKDLTVTKTNEAIGGIFVVEGDITLNGIQNINGILYLANSKSKSLVLCTGFLTYRSIYGGIIGNSDIQGGIGLFGPRLRVFYNSTFLEKFYTYTLDGNSYVLHKLSWVSNY